MTQGHLIVIVHGLWGSSSHVSTIDKCLQETFKEDSIYTLTPRGFSFFRTYDGIKICGDVVIDSIFDKLIELRKDGVVIDKISFVGYSLGGLICRYCMGQLYNIPEFYQLIKPISFTTFATPHLGIKFFNNSISHLLLNFLGTNLLGKSGKDLFIADDEKLLIKLIDPDGVYYKALLDFKTRILLANVRNDRTVPFYTLFITKYNPFNEWHDINLKYLSPVPEFNFNENSIKPRIIDLKNSKRQHRPNHYTILKITRFIFILCVVLIVLPIWLPLVFTLSFFGTLQSNLRNYFKTEYNLLQKWQDVKNNDDTHIEKKSDSHPIEEEFAQLTETYIENALAAEENLLNSNDELSINDHIKKYYKFNVNDSLNCIKQNKNFFHKDNFIDIDKLSPADLKQNYPLYDTDLQDIEITLDQDRLTMLKNFESLSFIKLPVYIDIFNLHDGIISRRGYKSTPRGVATILLWCSLLKTEIDEI